LSYDFRVVPITDPSTRAMQHPADPGHVLVAVDKFKGTLDAPTACAHLGRGLRAGGATPRLLPVADGGEGSVEAALAAGFAAVRTFVVGPSGAATAATWAIRGDCAVLEAAQACGLGLVDGALDPLTATSWGVGELVSAALDRGCERIVLCLGGSATVDGGAGMLTALGARLSDRSGSPLMPGGGALVDVASVDLTGLDTRLAEVELVLAADVDNPLLGPTGTAPVYGPQKGASAEDIDRLESGLARLVACLPDHLALLADRPGAGAAGGLGYAGLVAGGTLRPGADLLLDLLDFDSHLEGATMLITGEGRLDHQTLRGKAPATAAARARRRDIPTIAVVGACTLNPEELRRAGFDRAVALTDLDPRCADDPQLSARLLEAVGAALADHPDLPHLTNADLFGPPGPAETSVLPTREYR
jgi:glycerate kinase